jgi:molecular chaperone HscC
VAGDNFLGGEDFTEVLIGMFLRRHDIAPENLTPKQAASLYKSAETAKIGFTSSKVVTMTWSMETEPKSEPPIAPGYQSEDPRILLTMEVTLDEYANNCEFVLARLKAPVVRALGDAAVKLTDVDAVVLVGGATKLKIVRSFVSKLFGRLPAAGVNPDEAVALGAAVQAAMKERNQYIKELLLTDVCPYTLGTEISLPRGDGFFQSGNFLPIIERNSVIPVSRVERLYTLYDNQKAVDVEILQGESRKVRDNIFLGKLTIPLSPAAAGSEAVDVRYTYDINGILEVEVTTVSTGAVKKMIIEKSPGAMSEEDIQQRLEDLSVLKIHPREKDEYKYLIEKGERLYQEHTGEMRQRISMALFEFEKSLDSQDSRNIGEAVSELKEFYEIMETYHE